MPVGQFRYFFEFRNYNATNFINLYFLALRKFWGTKKLWVNLKFWKFWTFDIRQKFRLDKFVVQILQIFDSAEARQF